MHKNNKNINLFIQKVATTKVILSSLLAFIFIMVMVNVVFKQDFSFLTQTFNYTPEYTYQLLNDIGKSGVNTHFLVFLPDILMVLLYTIFLTGANYAIYKKLTQSCLAISIITFSPLILSVIQLMEIILLTVVLLQYPIELFSLVEAANIITMIKMILTVIFFSIPFIGLGIRGIKKIIRKV